AGEITLRIPFITVAETVFTLQSTYGIDRADIGRELLKILNAPGIILTCPAWILDAIDEYRSRNISFGDACLAAAARAEGCEIASFDKGLNKFPGITRYNPK
ncbi:MAG TPA: PIN domain-containing protein, partial [Chthoniobacterales bacterium]